MLSLMIDIGNSHVDFGFFECDRLLFHKAIRTSLFKKDELSLFLQSIIDENNLADKSFEGGLICSVVPSLNLFCHDMMKKYFHIEMSILDVTYYPNLKNHADDVNEIGGDIIADIYGATNKYGCSSLVIDLGTINKIIPIDKDGYFLGTSFVPGVNLSLKLMGENAALLKSSYLKSKPKDILGQNTLDALQTGVYYSTLGTIKEFVQTIENKFGYKFKKIITGGLAHLFIDDLDDFIIDNDITIEGIYYLYKGKRG